jgi:hypothetical protein
MWLQDYNSILHPPAIFLKSARMCYVGMCITYVKRRIYDKFILELTT